MGYDITFRTAEQISPSLQREIVGMADDVFSKYSWVQLTKPSLSNDGGFMVGDTRLTVSPDSDDVADARLDGLPDARLTDLLAGLCSISRTFDVDWEWAHDYGELGAIRFGNVDPELQNFCDGFNEMFDGTMGDLDPNDFDFPDS